MPPNGGRFVSLRQLGAYSCLLGPGQQPLGSSPVTACLCHELRPQKKNPRGTIPAGITNREMNSPSTKSVCDLKSAAPSGTIKPRSLQSGHHTVCGHCVVQLVILHDYRLLSPSDTWFLNIAAMTTRCSPSRQRVDIGLHKIRAFVCKKLHIDKENPRFLMSMCGNLHMI